MKIWLYIFFMVLLGCATKKTTIMSGDLPTMKDIYDEQFHIKSGLDRTDVERTLGNDDADWNTSVSRSLDPIRQTFSYLPNPILTMYIFPHLTTAGSPVPGYTTFFKFYERDYVALPSEVKRNIESEHTKAVHHSVSTDN